MVRRYTPEETAAYRDEVRRRVEADRARAAAERAAAERAATERTTEGESAPRATPRTATASRGRPILARIRDIVLTVLGVTLLLGFWTNFVQARRAKREASDNAARQTMTQVLRTHETTSDTYSYAAPTSTSAKETYQSFNEGAREVLDTTTKTEYSIVDTINGIADIASAAGNVQATTYERRANRAKLERQAAVDNARARKAEISVENAELSVQRKKQDMDLREQRERNRARKEAQREAERKQKEIKRKADEKRRADQKAANKRKREAEALRRKAKSNGR